MATIVGPGAAGKRVLMQLGWHLVTRLLGLGQIVNSSTELGHDVPRLTVCATLSGMTRSEAITIINSALAAVDDTTLEAAAAHITTKIAATPSGLTVGDIVDAFATETDLPRDFSPRELELLEQSKEDFRLGRTRSIDESMSYVDAELDRRRRLRATA